MVKRFGLSLGFTLIEMAIVLVVIGLVLSGGLVAVSPVIQNSKNAETNQRLDRIEQALILYVITNGCLPCPAVANADSSAAATSGQSEGTARTFYTTGCEGTSCVNPQGVVPWTTLGLSEAEATDGFGTRISYAVSATPDQLQRDGEMVRTPPAGYPSGGISVANVAGQPITSNAAYVLVSHGSNRAHGFLTQTGAGPSIDWGSNPEAENSTIADGYVQDDLHPIQGTEYFDDIVRWRTAPMIIQLCGSNACGNPA